MKSVRKANARFLVVAVVVVTGQVVKEIQARCCCLGKMQSPSGIILRVITVITSVIVAVDVFAAQIIVVAIALFFVVVVVIAAATGDPRQSLL